MLSQLVLIAGLKAKKAESINNVLDLGIVTSIGVVGVAFESINDPISEKVLLEKEYRLHRESKFKPNFFTYPVEPGKCYDFFINNFKVQEKVCQNRGNSICANLSKSNSLV